MTERPFIRLSPLRIEFRFLTDNADSGIFVRAAGDATFGRGWPNNSYQVQLLNPAVESGFPLVGSLFRHGTPDGETVFDPASARQAFTGMGEWQTLEIEVVGDTLLTQASNIVNPTGYIGIQGETSALEFRKIEIAER